MWAATSNDAQVELVLSLSETARLQDVRRLAAERLGAPPQGLRFWRWVQRQNGTYRPSAPVDDGVALSVRSVLGLAFPGLPPQRLRGLLRAAGARTATTP